MSIERARKLGARNYDGIGDPEKAWSWQKGYERVFNVMGCSDEHIVTDYEKKFSELCDMFFYFVTMRYRKVRGL